MTVPSNFVQVAYLHRKYFIGPFLSGGQINSLFIVLSMPFGFKN